ncbi:hypothetical protein [Dactylosporangium sp. CA-233914]|uniref:hypothetical protein n=1 Tax=Dactylosporangium sp. CA-233914 TaxID=3239934 RepID=UPI003D8C3232
MSNIRDLLAAEAVRQQPTQLPPFAELVERRQRRIVKRRGLVAGVMVLAAGAIIVPVLLARHSASMAGAGDSVTVTGTLQMDGGRLRLSSGAPRAPFRGVSGVVRFRAEGGGVFEAIADETGRFTLTISPGRYDVTGFPSYLGASSPPGVDRAASTSATPSMSPNGASAVPPATSASNDPSAVAPCRADGPVSVPTEGLNGVEVRCQAR